MHKACTVIKTFFVVLMFTGCALFAQEPILKNKPSPASTSLKNAQATVIVLFKEGVSFDSALKIIHAYDMELGRHYKMLSKQKGQIFMSVRSSQSSERMIKILEADPQVESVSGNYRRSIKEADK